MSNKQQRGAIGKVLSTKMNKTVRIQVERSVSHPIYGKIIKKTRSISAHDANEVCSEGDIVVVVSIRPLSKVKTWIVTKVIQSKS